MVIYDKNKQPLTIDLKKEIASGGEGKIFINPNNSKEVLKIYHQPKNFDERHFDELMKLPNNFIKPIKIYYDTSKRIVGFSMKYFNQNDYHIFANLLTKNFCLKHNITQSFKEKVFENIVSSVKEAHNSNIVVGDLNQYNIMVNKQGEVYFVDVDSYGTKYKSHNGVLLDDIRDWTAKNIDDKSDMYAADVLGFYFMTYLHPFGGTLRPHATIKDRVVSKTSVLSKHPDLILPKIYQPFADNNIQQQFFDIFQNDKRFFVTLNGLVTNTQTVQPISTSNLKIQKIDSGDYVFGNLTWFVMRSGNKYVIYDISEFGKFLKKYEIVADDVFVGNKNILYRKGLELFHINGTQIKLFFPSDLQYYCFNDINNNKLFLVDGESDKLVVLDIDLVVGNNIQRFEQPVYAKAVFFSEGIYQNVAGNKLIFSPSNPLNILLLKNINFRKFIWKNKHILIEYVENNQIKHKIIKTDGVKILNETSLSKYADFDVKNDLVFLPDDNKILVVDVTKNSVVSEISCNIVNDTTKLIVTNAGIIVFTNGEAFLINKI